MTSAAVVSTCQYQSELVVTEQTYHKAVADEGSRRNSAEDSLASVLEVLTPADITVFIISPSANSA
ncbi:MAG: hypothetical protein ACKESB_01005 [Candidatus Hodgkinia cicadicola]